MGKIVKFCNACDEGFAEKFGFCPNCGAPLTAFELNPVVAESKPEPVIEEIPEPEVIVAATVPVIEAPAIEPEPVSEPEPVFETAPVIADDAFEFEQEVFEPEPELIEVAAEEPEPVSVAAEPAPTAAFEVPTASREVYAATYAPNRARNDGFHVTIVEEKNVKERNLLLLGFFILFFGAFGLGLIYSLFNKFLDVGAIDTPDLIAYVGEVEPMPFEEEKEIKKDDEKGGGGGGGGKEENTPASKGREAAQVPDPITPPSSSMDRLTNPTLTLQMATKNKNPRPAEDSDEPYGVKDGVDGRSDGLRRGGGLGNGNGRGQGNGNGEGLGNGNGSGRGNGDGDGEGNGRGGGTGDFDGDVVKKGPTVGVKIISKPRPGYTDSARVNNIQGTVILKVTFLASGQIGGVSVIKGLPNGLTEQAIAAAKSIRFEPAKRGGTPYAVNKNVEYSFTIF